MHTLHFMPCMCCCAGASPVSPSPAVPDEAEAQPQRAPEPAQEGTAMVPPTALQRTVPTPPVAAAFTGNVAAPSVESYSQAALQGTAGTAVAMAPKGGALAAGGRRLL